jgi:hypothetical protein
MAQVKLPEKDFDAIEIENAIYEFNHDESLPFPYLTYEREAKHYASIGRHSCVTQDGGSADLILGPCFPRDSLH